jgi:hypothetical protein
MNESIAEAADVLMSLVERIERARFDLARVTADDGVALAFYRRVDATSADEATAYAVVLDEESPSQWEALVRIRTAAGWLPRGKCAAFRARRLDRRDLRLCAGRRALPSWRTRTSNVGCPWRPASMRS